MRANLGAAAVAIASVFALSLAASNSALAQNGAAPAHIDGIVFDSLDALPLAGAIVQLVAAPPATGTYAAVADSAGRFHINSVRAGTFIAGFQHPLLDTLGISAPFGRIVISEGQAAHLVLAIPSERAIARAICGVETPLKGKVVKRGADSTGMLVGHVHDGATGAAVAASSLILTWTGLAIGPRGTHTETRSLKSTTNADGWFAVCQLAPGDYDVHAELGRDSTGRIDVEVRPRALARVSLTLDTHPESPVATKESASGATLTGIIKTHEGVGLPGAQVVVDGIAASATTDAQGKFVLTGLPDGSRMAEARALGYEPVRFPINPLHGQEGLVSVTIDKKVETLGAVTVVAKAPQVVRDRTGFQERMKRGFGTFITEAQIDEANVLNLCELLRRKPGVLVVDQGMGACAVQLRGAASGADRAGAIAVPHPCEPIIFDDAVKFGGTVADFTRMVSPRDIKQIEIYTASTQPIQFSGGCGAIVVWTRDGK